MNKHLKLTVIASFMGLSMISSAFAAEFVFLDEGTLQENRALLQSKKAPKGMQDAYEKLIEEANIAMTEGPFSVTDKTMIPPSGDKHDYLSISPYWWPDESKEDGLPWIRRDGKTNPVSKTADTDSVRIGHFTRSVRALAQAYYFTQDQKYADKAIELVRAWYIDNDTKMNPNVNFAQGVPGVADGRRSGLIDTRTLVERMVDSIAILSKSPTWTAQDEKAINQWYTEYLNWLIENDLSGGPKGEAYSENNHGTWYDYQVAGVAAFVGNDALAKQMVQKGKMRIDTQIEKDGTQPHEAERTRSYHYHYFNLDAMVGLAEVGNKVGVDLWTYKSPKGGSLTSAIQLMADYNDPAKEWPFPEQDARRRVERLAPILYKAGVRLNQPTWINLATQHDFTPFTVQKDLGEVWAQREIELLNKKQ